MPKKAPFWRTLTPDKRSNTNGPKLAPKQVQASNALLKMVDGKVFLYGPFLINGEHTSESNLSFDGWLKSQSEAFGVRSIEEVMHEAEKNGLELSARHEMPSNNFIMEFRS